MALVSCGATWDNVRKAIASSYFHHAARLKGLGEYINLKTGMPCFLHPTSSLYGLGYTPEYLVYHELVYTTKEYMQCVTATDPQWLAELGPVFFAVKESHESRVEKRKKEKQGKEDMEEEMNQKIEEDKVTAEKQREEEAQQAKKRQKVVSVGVAENGNRRKPRRYGI